MNKEIYGLSRNRDDKGDIVKRRLNQYVNTLHTSCGGGWKTIEILVVEVYEEDYQRQTARRAEGQEI